MLEWHFNFSGDASGLNMRLNSDPLDTVDGLRVVL